jgi:transcriptional regulator with XRE-family HTH domain
VADVERPDRINAVAIEERRRHVAALTLRGLTQKTIARQLGVTQPLISQDLAALREQWRQQSLADLATIKIREAAKLDAMEEEIALRYSEGRDPHYLHLQIRVMTRRAHLLGLDEPKQEQISGEVTVTIDDERSARGEFHQLLMAALTRRGEAEAALPALAEVTEITDP